MVRLIWPGWWLGLLVGAGFPSAAQTDPPAQRQSPPVPGVAFKPRVELKENYPNPFIATTTIPFEISPEVCAWGRRPRVVLKVYNVLVQLVAVLVDGTRFPCGTHRVYWDGDDLDGVHEPKVGVYYYQLTVDGERFTRKMIAQEPVTSQQ